MKKILFLTLILLSPFALAQEKTSALQSQALAKIEQYLNNITTLVSPFTQVDAQGVESTGTFYLSRPGRLRWDYNPPTPILIVAKGSLVAYQDKELDQVSHVGLDDTLAGFLTRKNISFNEEGVKVLDVQEKDGEISITITQNSREDEGTVTMFFKRPEIGLTRMEVMDSIGKTTSVTFDSIVYGKELDKDLFVLPRSKGKIRKN